MNNTMSSIIDNYSPRFTKKVVDGSAKEILKLAPQYLDEIFRSSIKSLSPTIPLTYVGWRRMMPDEEFVKIITSDSNKITYDIAVSDLYVIEYIFDYNGEEIRKPIYLPYCERGNLLRISNTYYNFVPILSDTVVSPTHKEVFVRLLKDKLTFSRKTVNFLVNGKLYIGQIIYTAIVKTNRMNISDNLGNVQSAVSLYMLGQYGFKEIMARYAKDLDYIVTTDNVDKLRDTYNVYESIKERPSNLKTIAYQGHDVKVLINKKTDMSKYPFLENFIFGFIYTLDLFPEHSSDFMEAYTNNNIKDEILFWRILLGRIVYRNSFSIDRIVEDMEEHFSSLQYYLDELIASKLSDNGIRVTNFFDLLIVILSNFNRWLLTCKEYNSNIGNRYIDILYYAMYDIIIGFNKTILNLNKRGSKKALGGILSKKEVVKILNDYLKTRAIFGLVKSSAMNICIQLTESTSDIMYPKVTALLDDQSRGAGVKRGKQNQFPEATKTLRGYALYIGSALFLNKKAPSPMFRSNLYMDYDLVTGRLTIPDKINESILLLDDMLKGRLENTKINVLEEDSEIEGLSEEMIDLDEDDFETDDVDVDSDLDE